jgi:hypothetical protein
MKLNILDVDASPETIACIDHVGPYYRWCMHFNILIILITR